MLNIFRIFISDFKRIKTNVVAVVIVIGLSILPCLYAWFNILSNWSLYQFQNILFAAEIGKGIVPHGFLEIDGV